jgi:hypothetical protein
LTREKCKNVKNVQEAELMKNISEGHAEIKKFEFDGKKYTRYYSGNLYKQLKQENEANEALINVHNQKIADWFYCQATKFDSTLAQHYFNAMKFRTEINEQRKKLIEVIEGLMKIYQNATKKNLNEADVKSIRGDLYHYFIKYGHLKDGVTDAFIPAELIEKQVVENYKATVYNDKLSDPTKFNGLDGFEYLYKWTNEVFVNMNEYDNKVFMHTVHLQDEVLKKMGLV